MPNERQNDEQTTVPSTESTRERSDAEDTHGTSTARQDQTVEQVIADELIEDRFEATDN